MSSYEDEKMKLKKWKNEEMKKWKLEKKKKWDLKKIQKNYEKTFEIAKRWKISQEKSNLFENVMKWWCWYSDD